MGKHLSHISESVIYLSENVRTMTRRVYHMSESVEDNVRQNGLRSSTWSRC